MKVTVIGAGAIGTLLAYKLSKAGEEITIIAKSEQISEIAVSYTHLTLPTIYSV